MLLNVNKLLHTPDAAQDVQFTMDLSDMEFGGGYPVSQPVTVEGRLRNKAGVLLCTLEASTTLHCVCDRCAKPFTKDKTVTYQCVLAEERSPMMMRISCCWSMTRWTWAKWLALRLSLRWTRKTSAHRTARAYVPAAARI